MQRVPEKLLYHSERGFTLIELVIVVAVIGIIAVPTTIVFINFTQAQALTGAAQQMVNHLNQARQLAITQNVSYKVDFDTTNGKLRFLRPATCTPATAGSCTPWTGPGTDTCSSGFISGTTPPCSVPSEGGWRVLENQARIICAPAASTSSAITFNFLGTGTGGTIQMKAASGDASRYVIVGTTGRIRTSGSGSCS